MELILYTTSNCPYCRAAKDLLGQKGIAYREIDVSEGDDFDALVKKTGWKTVPQIFIDGTLIGGFKELLEMDRQGKI